MKIAYLTTMRDSVENRRIRDEVLALGHEFVHIYLGDMSLRIVNGKIIDDRILNCQADLIILRGIMSSMKSISALAKYKKEHGIKVFDNNFIKHEYAISKITDMVKLSLNGLPLPDTYHLRDFSKYTKAAKKLKYPVVVKSNRMGKGHGVYKAGSEDELNILIKSFIDNEREAKNYVIQEYIPYQYDIRALIIGSKIFSMRRIPGKDEFRANYSLGGAVEVFDLDEKVMELSQKALKAVDMSVGGVDILITNDNKRYILEVNHNPGFAGMEEATGMNIAKVYVEHAIYNAK